MSCDDASARLDDYVDGELSEAEFQEVELHLASCPACADAHRELRELLAGAAALPRAIAPPRDLWPGIERRLGARPAWRSYALVGLAAAAAVALAVTVVVKQGEAPTPAPSVIPVDETRGLPPELAQAEREYERATEQLMKALETRRGTLPPETEAALNANLRAIDRALVEVRAAVRADPGNPRLNHLLASTHQRKVELLRQVVRLTT